MAFWGERRGSAVSAVAAWPLSARPRHCRGFGRRSLHQPLCRPPSSCIANQWFVEFAIYALASRLRASWMEARVTKAARFRQGLGVLGETPVFARTRRRYARPPSGAAEHEALMSSLRLTISMCHSGTFATTASTCHPLQPPSAQTRSSHGKRRRILSGLARPSRGPGSRRSGRRPASTALRCRPKVWILRPFTCLPAP